MLHHNHLFLGDLTYSHGFNHYLSNPYHYFSLSFQVPVSHFWLPTRHLYWGVLSHLIIIFLRKIISSKPNYPVVFSVFIMSTTILTVTYYGTWKSLLMFPCSHPLLPILSESHGWFIFLCVSPYLMFLLPPLLPFLSLVSATIVQVFPISHT